MDATIGTRQQEYRRRDYAYREREAKRNTVRNRTVDLWTKPFVGWDSEGDNTDASVFLFGNSEGGYIAKPRISSAEMFDLILETEAAIPNAWHIIFGGEYDWNMFLRDLPLKCLLALRDNGRTKWRDYKIAHVPRKWFDVSKDGVTARIYDVQLFFASSFVTAITEHNIGTPEEIARVIEGKADRSSFTFDDLAYIEPYWRTELKLLPLLADKLREAFYRAGMFITSWHGPGALARNILTNRNVHAAKKEPFPALLEAARYAFCGGRFESFRAGLHDGPVYNADINSAYPYAATFLPDLTTGEWEYASRVDRGAVRAEQFAVYHIRYRQPATEGLAAIRAPKPLFRRFHDDRVMWTNSVTGWYWSPEAELVKDDPHAEFLEAYIYHDVGTRPFKFLQEYYDIRRRLKDAGDAMQLSFKLGPNSVYGQLAQRAGWKWNGKAPRFHQLEWAGYVTSMCRAMVYKVGTYAWANDGLISIDTDGVFSTVPLPASILPGGSGTGLGEWDTSTVPGILYWQSGVFFVSCRDRACGLKEDCPGDGHYFMKKARGAPKGKIPVEAAFEALEELKPIKYKRSEFIGYRWALKTNMDDWRYFKTRDREIAFGGSPWSKRWHNTRACRKCQGIGVQTMHDLFPQTNLMSFDDHSKMHVLPWLENDHDRMRDPIDEKSDLIIDAVWMDEGLTV